MRQQHFYTIIIFRIPPAINPQSFIQKCCDISSVKSQVRYKVKFKIFADDARSLVLGGCHMEEHDGAFKHIWTRMSIKNLSETKDSWKNVKKIDVICPGRYCNTVYA